MIILFSTVVVLIGMPWDPTAGLLSVINQPQTGDSRMDDKKEHNIGPSMDSKVISAGPQPPSQQQHMMNHPSVHSGPQPPAGILSSPSLNSMHHPAMTGIVRPVQVPPQGMMFMHGIPGQMRPLLGIPQPGYPHFGGMPPRPPQLLNPMGGHGHGPPMPLMNHQGPPPGMMPPPPLDLDDEPLSKKTKSAEDALIPEGEFFATNASPATFNVLLPSVPEKPEMNLNGQLIPFTMGLTESISLLKTKINEAIGLGPGKQKLSKDGLFFKDQHSLAYYNVGENVIVQLSLKERGGRKK
jgi:splicing factor 3A subunit 1